jgi:Lon protease-like protein
MEIPLFPLPNLVLFPQVAVPLHIFEERYKLMISRCIDQSDVFGLVLLREGAEQESEDTIYRVGVTARIVEVEKLEDRRLNILCAGESRFRVLEFTGNEPYWTAEVELVEEMPDEEESEEVHARVSRLYRKAMELTSRVKEMEIPTLDLPQSPLGLSYMVSYVLDLKAERKQELLEMSSPFLRLTALIDDLETIIEQLQQQLSLKGHAHKAGNNGHLRRSL